MKAVVGRIPDDAEDRDRRVHPELPSPGVRRNRVAVDPSEARAALELDGNALTCEFAVVGQIDVSVLAEICLVWCLAEDPPLSGVDVYVAMSDAIEGRIAELNRLLEKSGNVDLATTWVGKVEKLRKAWDKMPIDEQRALILSVVGRSKVMPAEKRGRYATPDEVKARLVPLVDTSGRSPQPAR